MIMRKSTILIILYHFLGIVEASIYCSGTYFSQDSYNNLGPKVTASIYGNGGLDCEYDITPDRNNVYTVLTWDSFDVKGNMPDCQSNSVTVYVGCKKRVLVGTFCSGNAEKPFIIYSKDGCIKIKLKSASNQENKASQFLASYQTSAQGIPPLWECQSTSRLTGNSGVIISPNWPNNYRRFTGSAAKTCKWSVTTARNTHVKIFIMDLQLDHNKHIPDACVPGTDDVLRIIYRDYDENICKVDSPITKTSWTSSFTCQLEIISLTDIKPNNWISRRGFVLGYIAYGKALVPVAPTPTPTLRSTSSEGGLGTITIVIIVLVSLFGVALCCILIYKYMVIKKRQDQRNTNVLYDEELSNNGHALEEMPPALNNSLPNGDLTEVAPPAYQPNMAITTKKPSAPFLQDDADDELPSYQDVVSGKYR